MEPEPIFPPGMVGQQMRLQWLAQQHARQMNMGPDLPRAGGPSPYMNRNGPVILPDMEVTAPWANDIGRALVMNQLTPAQRAQVAGDVQRESEQVREQAPRALGTGLLEAIGFLPALGIDILRGGIGHEGAKKEPFWALQQLSRLSEEATGLDPNAHGVGMARTLGNLAPLDLFALAQGGKVLTNELRSMGRAGSIPATPSPGRRFAAYRPEAPTSMEEMVRANPEGGTVVPKTFEGHEGTGYIVSDPRATTYLQEGEGADKIRDWLADPYVRRRIKEKGVRFGWWFDKANNRFEINLSDYIPSKELSSESRAFQRAEKLGRSRGEQSIGIYDKAKFVDSHQVLTPEEVAAWGHTSKNKLPPMNQLPQDELRSMGWSLARQTVGTKSDLEWVENIAAHERKTNPGGITPLADRLRQSPRIRDQIYGIAKGQQKAVKKMDAMLPQDKAVAIAQRIAENSPESVEWYSGWRQSLRDALVESFGGNQAKANDEMFKITKASSVLSEQTPPYEEIWKLLRAYQAHLSGEDIGKALSELPKDPKTGAGLHGIRPTSKDQIRRIKEIFSGTEPPAEAFTKMKTAPYTLNKLGIPDYPTIDTHMLRMYLGKSKGVSDAEKVMVARRVMEDAEAAGMSTEKFQAALWANQTGYSAAFGRAGASPDDWMRYWLMSGEFDDLINASPGMKSLRNQGVIQAWLNHLPSEFNPLLPERKPWSTAKPDPRLGQTVTELEGKVFPLESGAVPISPQIPRQAKLGQHTLPRQTVMSYANQLRQAGRGTAARNFEKFMEESVVQKPVFHWTHGNFTEFKRGDVGFHFGSHEAATARGTGLSGRPDLVPRTGQIYPAWISLKRPLKTGDPGGWAEPHDALPELIKALRARPDASDQIAADKLTKLLNGIVAKYSEFRSSHKKVARIPDINKTILDEARDILKEAGYDGIQYKNEWERAWSPGLSNDSYIVFDANQIKSAFNKGSFSKRSGNILKSIFPFAVGSAGAATGQQQ